MPVQPTISMTPSTGKQYDPLEELDALDTPRPAPKATDAKKTTEKPAEKKPSNNSSWFTSIFSKIVPKPPNQANLPDDKHPTIVWDDVAKKWVNTDEDGDNGAGTLAPPPKTSDMNFRMPAMERAPSAHNEDAPATDISKLPTDSNRYRLPKNSRMRSGYVNIQNLGGMSKDSASSNVATPMTSPLAPIATSSPQMFVPASINDPTAPVDFPTPTATPPSGNVAENTPLSRWSSTSSLSREVQSYTMRDPRLLQRNKGPMMFNPSDMKDRSLKNMPSSRYRP